MWVTITGIKSEKTKNKIVKSLNWLSLTITGSKGNYQIRVEDVGENPVDALKFVVDAIRTLTPEHLSNLTWKVSSR